MKDLHIDKHLLELVLEKEILECSVGEDGLVYYLTPTKLHFDTINIYELAHRFKEWAYSNGYKIRPYKEGLAIYEAEIKEVQVTQNQEKWYLVCESEPDVVFRSCFWLLKNKIKA